ncbi:unnamed protein product [Rotaria sp. Silwood1]|nr:unnamed protein product [Rotaria sp. Silwood1]
MFITNPTNLNDDLAIQIGKLYVDTNKEQKLHLESGVNNIRDFSKKQEYDGKHFVQRVNLLKVLLHFKCLELNVLRNEEQAARERAQAAWKLSQAARTNARLAERKVEELEKAVSEKDNKLKRKYEDVCASSSK